MRCSVNAKDEQIIATAATIVCPDCGKPIGFTSAELIKIMGNGHRPQAIGSVLRKLADEGWLRKVCRLNVKNGPCLWEITGKGTKWVKA